MHVTSWYCVSHGVVIIIIIIYCVETHKKSINTQIIICRVNL